MLLSLISEQLHYHQRYEQVRLDLPPPALLAQVRGYSKRCGLVIEVLFAEKQMSRDRTS